MSNDDTPTTPSSGGAQSQMPPAQAVTVELDGMTMTSASAIAPHDVESLTAAMTDTAVEPRTEEADEPPPQEEPTEDIPRDEPPQEEPKREEPKAPAKKKSGTERHQEIQALINQATRELRETERRTQALRDEAIRLQQQQTRPPAPESELLAKRPRWKDYEDAGKSYTDYEEDVVKWDEQRDQRNQAIVEQRLAERHAFEEQRRGEDAYNTRVNEARQRHPDWDDTIRANLKNVDQTPFLVTMVKAHPKGAEIFYDFAKKPEVAQAWAEYDSYSETRPTQPILSALYESANPSAMLEHFATNRDEYLRIARMPPVSALLALGKLETAIAGAKNGSPARPISHAAAPLSHRAGSQQSQTPRSDDDMSPEEFVRHHNKREGKWSPV